MTRLIERGEKFEALSEKSQALTSISSGLKKRAKHIRQQSESHWILQMLSGLLGVSPEYLMYGIAVILVLLFAFQFFTLV